MRSRHSAESIVECRTQRNVPYCKKFQCRTKRAHPFVLPFGFLNARKLALVEKVANRDRHVDFRVNDEEYAIGLKNAEACGLSVSEYSRKRFIGNEPKLHLTEREIEAYKSLSDARGDLVHIRSALKGKTQEQIRNYFNDPDFMREWILAINNIIEQWDTILEQMKD